MIYVTAKKKHEVPGLSQWSATSQLKSKSSVHALNALLKLLFNAFFTLPSFVCSLQYNLTVVSQSLTTSLATSASLSNHLLFCALNSEPYYIFREHKIKLYTRTGVILLMRHNVPSDKSATALLFSNLVMMPVCVMNRIVGM
jgi:hypothetical protein